MVLTSCAHGLAEGESPMQSVKRLLTLSALLVTGFITQASLVTRAQTPETKPKPSASISGRVTIGEKPAPGVVVAALTVNYPQALLAQAVSDNEGKYRLSALTPGPVTVAAVAPTFVMPFSPSSLVPGRTVNLSADEVVEGIDFKLTRGGVITGRVVDADGKPLIEERLTLTPVDGKGEPLRSQPPRAANLMMNSTDDRGIYRIYGLPSGRYKVSAGDNGGGASLRSGYYTRTYYPNTTEVAKAEIVELSEGGEARNIDITLGPRSRTYTATGRFVDADTGQPLAGINYAFGVVQQNHLAGYSSPGTPTNSNGEFRLEGIAPGHYAVTVMPNAFLNPGDPPKVYSDPVQFDITDSDVTDIEVKARHALSISGVVVPEGMSKQALAGLLRLMVSGYNEATATGIQVFSSGTTSAIAADGSFQLDSLRPGKVSLSVVGFGGSGYGKGYSVSRVVADRELPNRQLELTQSVSGVRIYVSYGTGVIKGDVKIEGGTLPSDVLLFVNVRRENSQVSSAQVDARGHFTVTGIPAGTFEAVLQIVSLGSTALPNNLPRMLRQTVTLADDSESQITFNLDLTPKEKP
jgi:protocatechuate 3,4-dioxygenase beta subunit